MQFAPGFMEHTLLFLLGCVSIASAMTSAITSEYMRTECTLDVDGTNYQLDHCLTMGEQFAEQYEKFFRKEKKFDRCEAFQPFQECLSTLLNSCPNMRRNPQHRKWWHVYDSMSCVCNQERDCVADIECLELEHKTIYMSLCQDLYDFNVAQNTHGKCRFMREKLDCEASLISSACGEPAAQMYTSLVKVHPKKTKCHVPTKEPEYTPEAFRYTEHCPRNITEKISECSKKHPVERVLHFHEDNDLIVVGSRKDLKSSCASFTEYESCFEEISDSCPAGVQRILDYNGKLRSYMLKMRFICSQARRPYLESMYCFQEVLKNYTFDTCDYVWDDLLDHLDNLTSYEYYCVPDKHESKQMRRSLKEIEQCYEDVLNKQCNAEAGKTMARLISKAFQDPYYLQYVFKPDCSLHDTNPRSHLTSTTTTQTTKPTTTQSRKPPVRHRPKHIPNDRPKPQQNKPKSEPSTNTGHRHRALSNSYLISALPLIFTFISSLIPHPLVSYCPD